MSRPSKKKDNIPCEACGYDPTRTLLYTHTEVVPFKWLSGNIVNPYGHRSVWRYKVYKDSFKKTFSSVCAEFPKATGFVRLTLTRLYTGRQRDYDTDNLAQGAKPMLDTIKKLGIIQDDSPGKAQIIYKQEKISGKQNKTRIMVEGLE